jgi:hypothetical protein
VSCLRTADSLFGHLYFVIRNSTLGHGLKPIRKLGHKGASLFGSYEQIPSKCKICSHNNNNSYRYYYHYYCYYYYY